MRAEPNTVTARPTRASASKPSTNSPMMRSTRQGSVWTKPGSLLALRAGPRRPGACASRRGPLAVTRPRRSCWVGVPLARRGSCPPGPSASTLPPESTTPMRSARDRAGQHARRPAAPTSARSAAWCATRRAPAPRAAASSATSAMPAQRSRSTDEGALADLHRAHAVGDRRRRVVEAHAAALGERAVGVGPGGGLGAPDLRRGARASRRPAPRPRAARRRRSA